MIYLAGFMIGHAKRVLRIYSIPPQLEEKQFNKPHATKLYRQIVEDSPDSPYANQAQTRLAELEKAR